MTPSLSSGTVLVVDDSEAARYSMTRSLQAAGFRTLEAAGGAQALQLATGDVAAVVLDVHLPDLHGFEVCRLLRGRPETAALPLVHVSAVQTDLEDQVQGLSAGADSYLVHPVDPSIMAATLRSLIRARELHDQLRRRESTFRSAFARADCGLAILSATGQLQEVNQVFSGLLATPAAHLIGRELPTLVPARWQAGVKEAMQGWGAIPWRGQFPVAAGGARQVMLSWRVAPHDGGGSIAVVTAGRDASGDGAR